MVKTLKNHNDNSLVLWCNKYNGVRAKNLNTEVGISINRKHEHKENHLLN